VTKHPKPILHRRDHEHGGADPVRILWEDVGGSGGGGGSPGLLTGWLAAASNSMIEDPFLGYGFWTPDWSAGHTETHGDMGGASLSTTSGLVLPAGNFLIWYGVHAVTVGYPMLTHTTTTTEPWYGVRSLLRTPTTVNFSTANSGAGAHVQFATLTEITAFRTGWQPDDGGVGVGDSMSLLIARLGS